MNRDTDSNPLSDSNETEHLTRRDFVSTALATGFALAVYPLAASAFSTDTKGLDAGAIQIPTANGKIPGYWAMPAGKKDLPTVVVCHEIFGLHEHIRDVCRRFAKLGYLAIAPDLYFRQGDVTQIKDRAQIMPQVVSKVPLAQVLSDLDATIAFATQSGKAAADHVGITGFCWGGRTVWMYCAHNPKIKAGVAWYGPLVGTTALWPQAPVDIAAQLTVPVLGLYGGKDEHITADHIRQMETALKGSSSGSKIIVYPDAPHGFFADYRESYDKADAEAGLQQLRGWFLAHGVR
jgi:carboxymethylenebutenolidase